MEKNGKDPYFTYDLCLGKKKSVLGSPLSFLHSHYFSVILLMIFYYRKNFAAFVSVGFLYIVGAAGVDTDVDTDVHGNAEHRILLFMDRLQAFHIRERLWIPRGRATWPRRSNTYKTFVMKSANELEEKEEREDTRKIFKFPSEREGHIVQVWKNSK